MSSKMAYDLIRMGRALNSCTLFALNFCYTLNKISKRAEFFPAHFWSIDVWKWLEEVSDVPGCSIGLWLKTRQMMASWTMMIWFVWSCITKKNRAFICVSAKEELVIDMGPTYNSLLGKAWFIIKLLPPPWCDVEHGGQFELDKSKSGTIRNTRTGSFISGATANEDAGRSGGWDGALFDEASVPKSGERIFEAIKSCCYGPFMLVFTPNPDKPKGSEVSSRLWFSRSAIAGKIKKFTTHWTIHPDRDQAWYERACEGMTAKQIAAELDMSFGGTSVGRCFTTWEYSKYVGPARYVPGEDIWRIWDFGWKGTACLIGHVLDIHTKSGMIAKQFVLFDTVISSDKSVHYYREQLGEKAKKYTTPSMAEPFIEDIGDAYAIDQHDSRGYTWRLNLQNELPETPGLYKVFVGPAKHAGILITNLIDNVSRAMRMYEVDGKVPYIGMQEIDGKFFVPALVIAEHLLDMIESCDRYSYPTDRSGENITSEKPNKDIYSHPADALQYWIWHCWPPHLTSDWVSQMDGEDPDIDLEVTRDELEDLTTELNEVLK